MTVLAEPSAQAIIEELSCGEARCNCRAAVRRGRGLVHCPVHNDPGPSFNVSEKDGEVLVHCQAGCSQQDAIRTLREAGLWPQIERNGLTPLPAPRRAVARVTSAPGEPVAIYEYRAPNGTLIAEKGRWEQDEHKNFGWRKPGGSWRDGIRPLTMADMPLWGAELVAAAPPDETVWLCEGEKATQACRARGLLAVTFGGGAGSTEFGTAFDVLRGHTVMLWPDNDAPGRTYAGRVVAHLKPLGIQVRMVTVAVPEKGDAHDYFAGGGSLEKLLERTIDKPIIEFLAEDAIRVRLPSVVGVIVVTCAELVKSPRALDADVRVQVLGPPERDAMQCRLNLQSLSQVTELRRTLDGLHGQEIGWTQILNQALGMVRDGFLNHDPSIDAADIEASSAQPFHVDTLLPAGEPTVLFGDGSAGKSYLTFGMALCASHGQPFLGLTTQGGKWLVIDYERGKPNFGRRMSRIAQGLGFEHVPHGRVCYWPARGTPLPDLVPALAEKIRREGITGVIIDSAAAACGGEPESAEVALRYFRALDRLGVTSLTIAHITKGGDSQRPFGSAFWHNAASRTWYIERVERQESDTVDIGLYCRKVNDGRLPREIAVEMLFDGKDGAVTYRRHDIRDVAELDSKRVLVERLWDLLASGAQPIHQLADASGEKPDTVKKCLERNLERFAKVHEGSKGRSADVTTWGRLDRPVPFLLDQPEALPF